MIPRNISTRPLALLLAGVVAAACGGAPPRPKLPAASIVAAAQPAIVVIRAGDHRGGHGVILDSSGLIAVTLHVIQGESQIRIQLPGEPAEHPVASIAGFNVSHDLALVRIDAPRPLPTVTLGDPGTVEAGDLVVEVSSVGGSEGKVEQVRFLTSDLTILQVTAANPEEWSGPLFNQQGDVVGMTAAFVNGSRTVIAIPAVYLRQLVEHQSPLSPEEFAKQTAQYVR